MKNEILELLKGRKLATENLVAIYQRWASDERDPEAKARWERNVERCDAISGELDILIDKIGKME